MVTHFSRVRKNAFGGTTYSTLCGRVNAASQDGMNLSDNHNEVTCKFCLKRMAVEEKKRGAA